MPLIRSNDVELFYDLTGPEGAPVVAFSNSIGTTLEMWDRQVSALSDRYRCLRYDTRGLCCTDQLASRLVLWGGVA